ncbi:MAG: hypothetical protein IJG43_10725 [Acidaminococcaceae bacterium]|nr:hypothetical protein [Acidaminococcaceae bacterium]
MLLLNTFYRENGQGIVEYAILLAFVVAVAAFLFTQAGLKDEVTATFSSTASILRS